jgi:DNA-binding NarL/FixJ family response regulator
LVLVGPPGVGKTRLAQEILGLAQAEGWATLWVVASPGTSVLPLGAFHPLLPDLSGVSRFDLLGRVAAHLVAQAEGRRLLIGIDDAQGLDDTSAGLVHQLVVSNAAFVLLTVRRGVPVPDAITAVWKDELGERLEVRPLARAESCHLVETALGGSVDGATLHDLCEFSQGNVMFLRELVLGGLASGHLVAKGEVWRWTGPITLPERLVELVQARMGGLTPAHRAALEVVAFGEPLGADVVERMGDEITLSLEVLERAGLLTVESAGGRSLLRMAHPLYGEVLRGQTPSLRARSVHRQLASVVAARKNLHPGEALRVAIWHLAAGDQGNPVQLTAAANYALHSLDNCRAEEFARAAISAGGGSDARRILATALARQGLTGDAEAAFARIPADIDEDDTATAIARAINLQWRIGRAEEAAAVLAEAAERADSPSHRAEIQAVEASFLNYDLECAKALRIVQPVLDGAVDGLARLRALAAASQASSAVGLCDTGAALAREGIDLAERLEPVDPSVRLSLGIAHLTSTLWAGRVAQAAEVAEVGYRSAIVRHSSFEMAAFAGWLAVVARMEGRLIESRALGREAVEHGRAPDVCSFRRFLPRLLTDLALTSAMCGDAPAAEAALDEARSLDDPPTRILQLWASMAEPWVAAAHGATSRALSLTLQLADQAADLGLATYELMALHDALRMEPAADVVPRLTALAQRVQGGLAAACANHAEALAASSGVRLDHAAEQFANLGATLYAAETAVHAALAHRKRGAMANALLSANRARNWAARCEGASTPSLRMLQAPPELTPREREIAGLAARGCTSKDIAEELVISVRTVDNALHDIYGKLGINRRAHLTSIMGTSRPNERQRRPSNIHTVGRR